MLATVLETNLPKYKSTKSESTFEVVFNFKKFGIHVNFSLRFFTERLLPMINDLIEKKNPYTTCL